MADKSKGKELIKNSAIIFLGRVSTRFLSFILLPFYTALLAKEEYGISDLISTYVTLLVPLISLELENGAFRFIIEREGKDEEQNHVLYNVARMTIAILAIYTVGFVLIASFWNIPYAPYVYGRVAVGILCTILLQVARGFRDNIGYSAASFISGVLSVISIIYLIRFCHWGADGVLLGNIIGITFCVLYLIKRLNILSRIKNGQKDDDLQKEILRFSTPLILNAICWWIINAADRTVVTALMGLAANGIYAVSIKFPSAVASLFSIFNLSWLESASVHINDSDRESFFNSVFDNVLRLFGSIGIMLIVCMPVLFKLFVHGDYGEAYQYIPPAMIGAVLNCLANMYNGVYVALKKTDNIARTSLIAGVIDVVVDLVMIRYIGIYATALSTIIAYIWMMWYRGRDIRQYVQVGYSPRTILIVSGLFAIAGICYYTQQLPFEIAGFLICTSGCVRLNRNAAKMILGMIRKKRA